MQVSGVDLSSLGDQFYGYTPGRTLILDGDGPAYIAATTVKTLSTAVRKYQSLVLSNIFEADAERAIVHLTASGSYKAGRHNIIAVKPYQGNRDNKPKPPLLEPLREAMAHESNWLPQFEVVMNRLLEADDAMIIDAHRLAPHGVIRSEDKDLRLTPHLYYEIKTGQIIAPKGFGWLYEAYTPSGSYKLLGYGRKFFWAQMLMGDTADNVAGLTKLDGKLCGPKCAWEALDKIDTESACANFVISAYRRNKQNPLAEGWLLWLLRTQVDNFLTYLGECNLTPENQAYIQECGKQQWFRIPESIAEYD